MTYFPDLSFYTYGGDSPPTTTPLNIGWLGRGEPFLTDTSGWLDQGFLDNLALFEQKEYRVNQTRGWHICELCEGAGKEVHEDWEKSHKEGKMSSNEIRVLGLDGVVYAAPSLLRHYLTKHQYKPPEPFIQAVLHGPRPSSRAYSEAREQSSWYVSSWPEGQWLRVGRNHFFAGHYTIALEAFEQALRLAESVYTVRRAYAGKGITLCALRRYEEALSAYEQALLLDPSDALAYAGKGEALHALGRDAESLRAYEQAVHFDPTNDQAKAAR